MSNTFFTLSSDADDIGSVSSISSNSNALGKGDRIYMYLSNAKFDIYPSLSSSDDGDNYKILEVKNHDSNSRNDGITNYTIKFDTQTDFQKSDGSQSSSIDFISSVSDEQISNLINQLNFNNINSNNGTSSAVSSLFRDIQETLEKFPQSLLTSQLNDLVKLNADNIAKMQEVA